MSPSTRRAARCSVPPARRTPPRGRRGRVSNRAIGGPRRRRGSRRRRDASSPAHATRASCRSRPGRSRRRHGVEQSAPEDEVVECRVSPEASAIESLLVQPGAHGGIPQPRSCRGRRGRGTLRRGGNRRTRTWRARSPGGSRRGARCRRSRSTTAATGRPSPRVRTRYRGAVCRARFVQAHRRARRRHLERSAPPPPRPRRGRPGRRAEARANSRSRSSGFRRRGHETASAP